MENYGIDSNYLVVILLCFLIAVYLGSLLGYLTGTKIRYHFFLKRDNVAFYREHLRSLPFKDLMKEIYGNDKKGK